MKNKTVLSTILLGLSLVCSSYTQAATTKVENPVKKKGTVVLNESKKTDDEIRNQLDALLEEMSTSKAVNEEVSELVLNTAFDFEGVRYRFGGTTRSGMDCSGLVMNAFNDTSINLPRNSSAMAQVGDKVSKNQAQKGDLIFFRTGRGSRISHVGIITEVIDDEIKFIHSSTSKGVIVSSTKEDYYKRRFVQINRVLTDESI
ncbi:C40 family peptidase [Myroides sp. WP-1]|uniref:C40 family peptidase n=1 Tax=Myroides sp. WP-1 TaxID=2759944 RepID=UPI0015FC4636|nr:C40 family peptidase [Myroides sp. WP-1]MBB1139591.1 C40 family peptidase [Myroides sp. WP-1]